MLILVCNVGSTSLKYKLFDMPCTDILVEAKTERVGRTDAIFSYRNNRNGFSEKLEGIAVPGYADGIRLFLRYLLGEESGALRSIDELHLVPAFCDGETLFGSVSHLTVDFETVVKKGVG